MIHVSKNGIILFVTCLTKLHIHTYKYVSVNIEVQSSLQWRLRILLYHDVFSFQFQGSISKGMILFANQSLAMEL